MQPIIIPNPATEAKTLEWLARAADDPVRRHPKHLPEVVDFSRHAGLFLNTYHAAPHGIELGFPILLQNGKLDFPTELASQAHYPAFIHGKRFLGTMHVHPAGCAPFFDAQDLANTLRSDNPGFIDLLLAHDRLYALVRANPYLYISAHHVNRNPLLLREDHEARIARLGSRSPDDPDYAAHFRKASLYYFQRYQLALYEGDPQEPLKRTVTPQEGW